MKKLLLVLLFLCVLGCDPDNRLPRGLNKVKRPLTIVTLNKEGVTLMDGEGLLYSYHESYYFSQNLLASDLKVGDVLAGSVGEVVDD